MVRLKLCRTRYHIYPLIILLICCFSICRSSSRHRFTSIGEIRRTQAAENRLSTDENYLQKLDVNSNKNNHQFLKSYRAREALNRFSSIFEHNPFSRNRPKARSLNNSPKINPFLKSKSQTAEENHRELKPPNVIISQRNKTYFQQLLNSKQLPDDEHPILIKNNHGKLSDFVKPFKPFSVTASDLVNTMSITSRTTASLMDIFDNDKNTSTSKKVNSNKEIPSKETSSSMEYAKTTTQATVFDDELDIYHKNANNLNYTSLSMTKDEDKVWNASSNIIKPIRDWNNHHHLAHLNHHMNHHTSNSVNHNDHSNTVSANSFTKHSTSSPVINHRLTTGPSHKQTTLLSPHRTPAHVIITKKGNYTTNNSSKYFATPSYSLEKKKPMRFSLKPVVVSTGDKKQQIYTENDNPVKVNSYEDLDFVYSTTAMPMDSYENGLNIKHPDHLVIVHSNQHLIHPFHSKTNTSMLSVSNSQRNNTKIANISKWPLKMTTIKTNQQNNFTKIGQQNNFFQNLVTSSSTPSSSSEEDSFTQLQSQHQASIKNPFHHHHHHHTHNYSNLITQRPTLQVTQLNGVYTKPDSDLVHSEITVMDHHDSSEQQTSTTIMHNNLVVSYKPGRPLPNEHHFITTTPSYVNLQQSNEQISQNNILSNVKYKPDQHQLKLPLSPGSSTKTNLTFTKIPKPPIKYKPNNKINISNTGDHKIGQQQSTSSLQPPRRVGVMAFSQQQQTSQQTQQEQQHIHQQQITSSNHTSSNNSTSGQKPHRHQNGYVNAIFAPPMPSRLFSTPSPQIVNRNPLLAWLGVDSLSQLIDRSFLFRTFVVILTILLLPPLTVVAAITSIG